MSFSAFFLLSSTLLASSVMAQTPVEIPWSNKTYGSEGPWHAVSVQIGTPPQRVDLFPALSYSPNVLSRQYCLTEKPEGVDCDGATNFFRGDKSSTIDRSNFGNYSTNNTLTVPMLNTGYWGLVSDYMSVPNKHGEALQSKVSMQLNQNGRYISGPDQSFAQTYTLGTLGLGAPEEHLHPLFPTPTNWNVGNMTLNYFYQDQHRLPSASYALHYGSVTARVAPSLVYGGYDRSLVLGSPISLPFTDAINCRVALGDISLGTAVGASPWGYANKTKAGLLQVNGTAGTTQTTAQQLIQVAIQPGAPYLMLPEATCDALAAELPVTYDAARQVYFWNTADARYRAIVGGANYLAFTFTQLAAGQPDVTIKLPFRLLNLTFDAASAPSGAAAPYFPCFRHARNEYTLGRAFLQGAVWAANWMPHAVGADAASSPKGSWMLAQAPGPGAREPDMQTLGASARVLAPTDQDWADSWAGHWTPLNADGSPSTSSSSSSSGGGLSAGAQAGIAVPVSLLGAAALALLIFFFARRRQQQRQRAQAAARGEDGGALPPFEKDGTSAVWELHGQSGQRAQLDGRMIKDWNDGVAKQKQEPLELAATPVSRR